MSRRRGETVYLSGSEAQWITAVAQICIDGGDLAGLLGVELAAGRLCLGDDELQQLQRKLAWCSLTDSAVSYPDVSDGDSRP